MSFDIEFRHLSYFVAVAEEGSFTKAATRLHVSQPNLTKQMKQLEGTLSGPLLIREVAGTRLTPAGLAFLPLATRLLQMRDDAARTASAVHLGRQSAFRLGYSSFSSRGLLKEAVDAYRELRPNNEVEQINEGSAALADGRRRQVGRGISHVACWRKATLDNESAPNATLHAFEKTIHMLGRQSSRIDASRRTCESL